MEDALEQLQPTLDLDDEELAGATAALSANPALAAQFIANFNDILAFDDLTPPTSAGPIFALLALIAVAFFALASLPAWVIVLIVVAVIVLAALLSLLVDWVLDELEEQEAFEQLVVDVAERFERDLERIPIPDLDPQNVNTEQLARTCLEVAQEAGLDDSDPNPCENRSIYVPSEADLPQLAPFRWTAMTTNYAWFTQQRQDPTHSRN